ncbi:MAG: ABC transporter ATP-binding protein [Candidatus Brocadiales bacterium]
MPETLLEINNLKTHFFTRSGVIKVVNGVSFDISKGETLAVVGESGCGKSTVALSIMRLIHDPPGKIIDGKINFSGTNLLDIPERQMRRIRGGDIAMIFQEPMTSLNPVLSIGEQLTEAVTQHQVVSKKEARNRTIEALSRVGIPTPEIMISRYPHQMSGGMKQRVMIAMALICNPSVLLADEPTTALDVTVQDQILRLIKQIQEESHMAMLLITHNLGVVAEVADKVIVMYAGGIIEQADVLELFSNALHPYTQGLFKSMPAYAVAIGDRTPPYITAKITRKKRLEAIPGNVPYLHQLPTGCKFWPRCDKVMEICRKEEPALRRISVTGTQPIHKVACWLYN